MAQSESFDFDGPAGRLEAILMLPDAEPVAAGVFCHAHPLHGGVMHFNPIFRAAKALQANGVACLRFNFRSVGRSQGAHDHGRGEQDDVSSALDEMARRFPGLPLVLGGFSFGSHMALRVAASSTRVAAVIAAGLALRLEYDLSFLASLTLPRLFVQGGADQFGSGEKVRALVADLPEPKWLVVVEGADHFFTGRLDQLQQAIFDWAQARPWERAGASTAFA